MRFALFFWRPGVTKGTVLDGSRFDRLGFPQVCSNRRLSFVWGGNLWGAPEE